MNAEILSVGTELLLGNIANTDARDLSNILSSLGINVFWHSVVGDNPERLTKSVETARSRADLIITTGGLGPTCDDLTKQTLAKAFGLELYFDEDCAAEIRRWFDGRGTEMTENNLQQAWLPKGCTIFKNGRGTAPGCAFEADGIHVIMLPGPPSECIPMFRDCAVSYLKQFSDETIVSHSLRIFGEGESAVESRLRDMMNSLTNPTLAPYAKEGEVQLRVTAKANSEQAAEDMIAPVVQDLTEKLGDIVYGIDVESLEERVSTLLKEKGKTLAAAESCTGGLLAKRVTDLPGASEIFAGGVTVYTNTAKTTLLSVPEKLIEEKGAVSADVAVELASRVREKLGADYGIGITGLAGPDGDGVSEIGTVFTALAAPEGVFVQKHKLAVLSTRERIRTCSVNYALDMLRRSLTGLPVERK